MKKTFQTQVENKKPARQIDAIKHEINKYVARERRKDLPEGKDFWDFDCKVGPEASSAKEVHLTQINKAIDELVQKGAESFYVELLAVPKARQKKDNTKKES